MKLNEYPAAIKAAALAVNELEHRITETRQSIARIEAKADEEVAFNKELKNDNQRKAHRSHYLTFQTAYPEFTIALNNLCTAKSDALARLEEIRNEFSVKKLECRLAIAQALTGLESRELVGM